MPELRSFDYVIIGGGTAACVLANRLTEDPGVRVLMLEAGPEPTSMWIKMPLAMGKLFTHPVLNWGFSTEPEAHLNNRTVFWPRGRVLGGCSCINGSAYIRGQAADYDGWKRLGNIGWSWADVLPYFQKIERREDPRGRPANGSKNGSKNGRGMVAVSYPTYVHPIARAFIEAGVRAGLPASDDLNGEVPEGISLMPYSVHRGVRQSSAEAYLRPARSRPNLVVETSALVRRILLQGRKATGVEFERNGAIQKALATREVISGGWFDWFSADPDAFRNWTGQAITRTWNCGRAGCAWRWGKPSRSRVRNLYLQNCTGEFTQPAGEWPAGGWARHQLLSREARSADEWRVRGYGVGARAGQFSLPRSANCFSSDELRL